MHRRGNAEQKAEAPADMETINLCHTHSRLGLQKGYDPADYNSRVMRRSTGLLINFQERDEPPQASLRGRT